MMEVLLAFKARSYSVLHFLRMKFVKVMQNLCIVQRAWTSVWEECSVSTREFVFRANKNVSLWDRTRLWETHCVTCVASCLREMEGMSVKVLKTTCALLTGPLRQAARHSGRSAGRHPVCIWWPLPGLCWPEPRLCFWREGRIKEGLLYQNKAKTLGLVKNSNKARRTKRKWQ